MAPKKNRRGSPFSLSGIFGFLLAVFGGISGCSLAAPPSEDTLWDTLKQGGHIVLIRHADSSKDGDPPVVDVKGCKDPVTNLTKKGREQAELIGIAFRSRNIPLEQVLSSSFCRSEETAKLAFGRIEHWQPLDLFWPPERGAKQVWAIQRRLGAARPKGNLIMVSHVVNIIEVTGVEIDQAEMLVLTPDGKGYFKIDGRIAPPEKK